MTGFLVRSVSTEWSKNSVLAVDAGTHLAAVTDLLERDFPRVSTAADATEAANGVSNDAPADSPSDYSSSSREVTPEQRLQRVQKGPFKGAAFPHKSARANALHFVRECVSTYLITHPHLDHIAAFAINTAAFHNTSRPKRLAALPSTVTAIKTHIFNDIIWPNLTDEDGGVGFVTFQRLAQGGNIAVGEGSGKGYIEVCDRLCVKGMKVSHGHCTRGLASLPHRSSDVGLSEATILRSGPVSTPAPSSSTANAGFSPSHFHDATMRKNRRTPSLSQLIPMAPGTPSLTTTGQAPAAPGDPVHREVVVDSTAYFIRDDSTKREVLMFGDVEPDALSWAPRTLQIWQEAAPKVANGALKAIVIECSYDDSQGDAVLFGHLAPRHLVRELAALADLVRQRKAEHRERRESRKRKRDGSSERQRRDSVDVGGVDGTISPTTVEPDSQKRGKRKTSFAADSISLASTLRELPRDRREHTAGRKVSIGSRLEEILQDGIDGFEEAPLAGLKVLIMHMKDTMRDGPLVGESILRQLNEHEARMKELDGLGLGCEFVICKAGGSYYL